jgi:hypothetical protein
MATLWADVLTRAGIRANVQRLFLAGAAGELPPDQCAPEIWIEDDAQVERAREIMNDLQNVPQRRWFCTCGELIEGGFDQCWSCGALMPQAS